MKRSQMHAPSKRMVCLALATAVAWVSTANAQSSLDRIKRRNGSDSGKITNISVLGVTISKGGVENKIPVEEIRSIYFAGEPTKLNSARLAANAGRYRDALNTLQKIAKSDVSRDEVLQDLDYLLVFCNANRALAGQEDLDQATRQVSKFLAQHRNSYHVPAAIELYGDLFLAADKNESARKQYAKLGKAPAPYYQARSAILTGRSWQQEEKHAEAIAEFDRALKLALGNATAETQQLEATLLRAISQSAIGQVEQATAAIKKIITQADAEDVQLLARAYDALGDCYLQSGQKKAARDAFLHVDVLFSSAPTAHAKALYELSQLWQELGHQERAREAQQKLRDNYPESRWAKR